MKSPCGDRPARCSSGCRGRLVSQISPPLPRRKLLRNIGASVDKKIQEYSAPDRPRPESGRRANGKTNGCELLSCWLRSKCHPCRGFAILTLCVSHPFRVGYILSPLRGSLKERCSPVTDQWAYLTFITTSVRSSVMGPPCTNSWTSSSMRSAISADVKCVFDSSNAFNRPVPKNFPSRLAASVIPSE